MSASSTSSSSNSLPASSVLNISIVGGGNLAHAFIGLLGSRPDAKRFCVRLLTRQAQRFRDGLNEQRENGEPPGVSVKCMKPDGSHIIRSGIVAAVSDEARDIIPHADLIIVTVPSHARPAVLRRISPYLARTDPTHRVLLGAMPGLGGWDVIARKIVHETLSPSASEHITIFALKDVPWMCAFTRHGRSVTMLGPKTDIYLALADYNEQRMQHCCTILEDVCQIPTHPLDSFLTITLTPGNPIMHPAIMYGAFGPYSQWDGKPLPEKPLFYEHCSELSAYFLSRCDAEIQLIRHAIEQRTGVHLEAVWPLRLNLKRVYGPVVADNRTLLLALRTNKAYNSIRTPLKPVDDGGFTIDVHHRFFTEDVAYGLIVLHDIAQNLLGLETPMINEIALWCQELMTKEFLDPETCKLTGNDAAATGAPTIWGIRTIEELTQGSRKSDVKINSKL